MLMVVGLYIRLRILETPAFLRLKPRQQSTNTFLSAWQLYWREILLSALVRTGEQAPFYIFTTFVLSYGIQVLHLAPSLLYITLVPACAISLFPIPLFPPLSYLLAARLPPLSRL